MLCSFRLRETFVFFTHKRITITMINLCFVHSWKYTIFVPFQLNFIKKYDMKLEKMKTIACATIRISSKVVSCLNRTNHQLNININHAVWIVNEFEKKSYSTEIADISIFIFWHHDYLFRKNGLAGLCRQWANIF